MRSKDGEGSLLMITPSVIACGDATLPLLSLRDIFPRPGEVGPQGDGF